MKILFISSGNNKEGIGILVKNQGDSLIRSGIDLSFFTLKGKGVAGYLKNISALRKNIKKNKFDIIHAHYSLSGFVAALSGAKPLVVSLMGSDTYVSFPFNLFIKIFYSFFWNVTIVKTLRMKERLDLSKAIVLPNGVDMERFKPMDKAEAKIKVGFPPDKKYVIFAADPDRPEKNYILAKRSIEILHDENIILQVVSGISNDMIPVYMNAADVLLLTSKWEGSVNVIKEAMACNCPVVSTDVGDVRWLFGNENGYFITDYTAEDVAEKIRMALDFSDKKGRTNGHDRIIVLGLDSQTVANKIIDVYKKVIY